MPTKSQIPVSGEASRRGGWLNRVPLSLQGVAAVVAGVGVGLADKGAASRHGREGHPGDVSRPPERDVSAESFVWWSVSPRFT